MLRILMREYLIQVTFLLFISLFYGSVRFCYLIDCVVSIYFMVLSIRNITIFNFIL
jgi:hypothetical protein